MFNCATDSPWSRRRYSFSTGYLRVFNLALSGAMLGGVDGGGGRGRSLAPQ